jgi:hypothetical protein
VRRFGSASAVGEMIGVVEVSLDSEATSEEGFIYIKKEGSVVKVLHPYEIENYVHSFLEDRQMPPDLRDYIYKIKNLKLSPLFKMILCE